MHTKKSKLKLPSSLPDIENIRSLNGFKSDFPEFLKLLKCDFMQL